MEAADTIEVTEQGVIPIPSYGACWSCLVPCVVLYHIWLFGVRIDLVYIGGRNGITTLYSLP